MTINDLINSAAQGNTDAINTLKERAAAGDPQAIDVLSILNQSPPPSSENQVNKPAPRQIQNNSSANTSKPPTAEEMAAEMDKRNLAQEMAAQAAKQRNDQRKAAEVRAAQDTAARSMGYANADAFEKAGGKFLPPGSGGKGGGGGRGGGSKQPPLTAKQRNAMADEAASKAARRADSRGISDSAYARAERDSALFGDTPQQRADRISKMGGNPNYSGHMENPQTAKDVAAAQRMGQHNQWGGHKGSGSNPASSGGSSTANKSGNNLNSSGFTANQQDYLNSPQRLAANAEAYRRQAENEKDPERKARLNRIADSTQEMADRAANSSQNPMSNIKPLSDQSGGTPASDPADITPSVGGPDTSVPGLNWGPTIGPSASNSSGNASGALIGYLKKKKLGLV